MMPMLLTPIMSDKAGTNDASKENIVSASTGDSSQVVAYKRKCPRRQNDRVHALKVKLFDTGLYQQQKNEQLVSEEEARVLRVDNNLNLERCNRYCWNCKFLE